jgi:hypothetical protein
MTKKNPDARQPIKTVVEQGTGIVKSMLGPSRVTEKNFVICELVTGERNDQAAG